MSRARAVQQRREAVAGAREAFADLARGDLEAFHEFAAAAADLVDHALAGTSERQRDLVALLAERARDAVADLSHGLGNRPAGVVEIPRQVLMRAADREFHALGIADHGFALGHQFVDQGAEADLVVGIGALERGDLAADDRLELTGPRNGALDAVAHGGDLAPDGLAEREHRIGAHDLRLGQPQRDLGHRAGHQAHLLRPAIERCKHEKEDDGGTDGERQKRPLADTEGGEAVLQAAIDRAKAVAQHEGGAAQPCHCREACEPVGLGRGTD